MEADYAILDHIERVLDRYKTVESLLGEVLATLRLNFDRGYIRFRDGENDSEIFSKWLAKWESDFRGKQKDTND